VARHISTRYSHRQRSLLPIAELMADQFAARPGNYLAFFSSHDYLQQAAALFEARHPQIAVWKQTRRMGPAEQAEFLARLTPTSQGIGFAVLGGSFAEGIDLPGLRLIGAFIATMGMPQLNPVNEQLRQRIDRLVGSGHDYFYVYPGLQKVVQAAGRVIRSSSDQGVLHLMDDRYQRREVQRLLPAWWQLG
jgi:Rad3-related DNA helicase